MSTRTNTLLVAAVSASGGLVAHPEHASTSSEQQLRAQIAELQTEAGLARPEALVDPLRALALLYEEDGDHAFATATLEEARHVVRVHQGLTSAEEALLLRQQVRNEKALELHERAWDLEQKMVTMARQHHDDIRMLPIFRELAEDRLAVIEKVQNGERPPMVYAGCYNGVTTLPPYDYTRSGGAPGAAPTAGGLTSPCIGGINQDLVFKIRGEVLMYFADAIQVILKTGDYASAELRELEQAALRVRYGRQGRTVILQGETGGAFTRCARGTLEAYLALEILESCLAPVGRLPSGLVVANVGNAEALLRLIAYEVRSGAPASVRLRAVAELADHVILSVPIDRRRLDPPTLALTFYEQAIRELEQSGDHRASTELFAPDVPITLPVYEPNPLAFAATDSSRYIDVSFAVTTYGLAEDIEILDTSKGSSRDEERDLIRLIESTTFRPRVLDGKLADTAVALRYPLP